ncbi:hypothetical protein [Ralstonia mannitolilytica]|uniref:hypothetical protein n=2 Tax=Ralstonia mannitolilytica TaxID=105219 RepID=UPI0007AFE755|nr:hypothetical protein [Ralstonia mannitolilytica]ANA35642.1 hypothetical protein VZ52_19765 [Ralstonia mannitolilytica]MBY4718630.1 hypothetical protein [Ralstonia mannitolilytica]CAJ0687772.1 hypothetical protein R82526_03040 [Ralstonia mannitolilytica]
MSDVLQQLARVREARKLAALARAQKQAALVAQAAAQEAAARQGLQRVVGARTAHDAAIEQAVRDDARSAVVLLCEANAARLALDRAILDAHRQSAHAGAALAAEQAAQMQAQRRVARANARCEAVARAEERVAAAQRRAQAWQEEDAALEAQLARSTVITG